MKLETLETVTTPTPNERQRAALLMADCIEQSNGGHRMTPQAIETYVRGAAVVWAHYDLLPLDRWTPNAISRFCNLVSEILTLRYPA